MKRAHPSIREPHAPSPPRGRTNIAVGLLLLVCAAAYWPTVNADLVSWDDFANIRDNLLIRGFGERHFATMWTTFYMGVWQPLGWIGFTLIHAFVGVAPRAYHVVNLILHTLNVLLCFFVARRLLRLASAARDVHPDSALPETPRDRRGRSECTAGALVAAFFFGVHPLRVEAVAWATCQPYLLAGLFCLLSVGAYLRAVEAEPHGARVRWRMLSVAAFALSLMCKSIAVPLPVVLLLLDIVPLRRWRGHASHAAAKSQTRPGDASRDAHPRHSRAASRPPTSAASFLILEKLPYFALALATAVVASFATRGNAPLAQSLTLLDRLAVSAYGSVFYLRKTLLPVGLVPYNRMPLPMRPDAWPFVASAAVAVGITLGLLLLLRRRRLAGLIAWAAYLAILAPVLGLVQHGAQLAADRYSYLSCLPWAVLLGAGVEALLRRSAFRRAAIRFAAGAAGVTVVGALVYSTNMQVRTWNDTESLWRHTLAHDPECSLAWGNLGSALYTRHDYDNALPALQRAVELDARNSDAWAALGLLHEARSDVAAARRCFMQALELERKDFHALAGLGRLALADRDTPRAVEWLERALGAAATEPEGVEARRLLSLACVRQGLALAGDPSAPNRDKLGEAIELVGRAALLDDANHAARANLCALLPLRGNPGDAEEAVAQGRRAVRIKPDYALGHFVLAGALARAGKFEDAQRANAAAMQFAQRDGDLRLTALCRARAETDPAHWFGARP